MATQAFQSCIDACNACAQACDFCAASCLREDNPKAMARCITLDMDCSQLCRLTASYMSRASELTGMICQLCAEICEACGDECGKHEMDHCQECARACHHCADECRRMASQAMPIRQQQRLGAGTGTIAH